MTNRRVLQLVLVALVLSSTGMLAISTNQYYLIPVAIAVTFGAFCVSDVLEWISIEGWIANIASLAIFGWSMFKFYPADSAGKLIAVGTLLVCLQSVLLFQKKSPRLVWQIMVLSLLQVVITTIFSADFEGGFLFVAFFVLSGILMVLLNGFASEHVIEKRNQSAAESRKAIELGASTSSRLAFWQYDPRPVPTVTGLSRLQKFSLRSILILPGIALIAGMFTSIIFLTAPRQTKPWYSPIAFKVNTASHSETIDLEETGEISNTKRKIFEATFYPRNDSSSKGTQLSGEQYFRGVAHSNLKFEDGKTRWAIPYERVNSRSYQSLQTVKRQNNVRYAKMKVTMEKSAESVLYTPMPVGLSDATAGQIRFCNEISAVTRCRENQEIDFTDYDYELMVPLSPLNAPAKAWPYISNTQAYRNNPMANNPAQHRWLTRMDRGNYPTLVRVADRIAEQVSQSGGGRHELVKALEKHFLNPSNYSYTLDYSDVQRNLDIDPNEDFVANFKTGHCSAFASAMTLMLRSQGIPARLVTGFYGGEFDELNQSYVVRAWHAHSWVEVYMRKRDCTGNFDRWQYNDGGAWMIADPTPYQPVDDSFGTDNAINLARTVWQDYVLGLEDDGDAEVDSGFGESIDAFFRDFDMQKISSQFAQSREEGLISVLQPLLVVVLILAGIIGMLRILILNAGYEEEQPDSTVGKIKRFFADAIGLISTDLREWVIGYDSETAFYKKLTDILEKQDLVREPVQTHLEFANEVSSKFNSHPSADLISTTMRDVTEAFNRVRFGLEDLEDSERESLDRQLIDLEVALKVRPV